MHIRFGFLQGEDILNESINTNSNGTALIREGYKRAIYYYNIISKSTKRSPYQ